MRGTIPGVEGPHGIESIAVVIHVYIMCDIHFVRQIPSAGNASLHSII